MSATASVAGTVCRVCTGIRCEHYHELRRTGVCCGVHTEDLPAGVILASASTTAPTTAARPDKPEIEDVGPGLFEDDREIFLCSIAISLKRIADTISRIPGVQNGMLENIANGLQWVGK